MAKRIGISRTILNNGIMSYLQPLRVGIPKSTDHFKTTVTEQIYYIFTVKY